MSKKQKQNKKTVNQSKSTPRLVEAEPKTEAETR